MADYATLAFDSAGPPLNDPAPVDFVRNLGRQLPRTTAPEGWVKRIDRRRVGRVWVGLFHLWTTDAHGRRVRKFKEKTLGPASMPKHDAQKKLADYIEEYTGRLTNRVGAAVFNPPCIFCGGKRQSRGRNSSGTRGWRCMNPTCQRSFVIDRSFRGGINHPTQSKKPDFYRELSVSVRSYDRESRTGGCAGYSAPAIR